MSNSDRVCGASVSNPNRMSGARVSNPNRSVGLSVGNLGGVSSESAAAHGSTAYSNTV